MPENKLVSVIIPAHNEEAVMARCLSAMTAGAAPGELEIIVVCNACTDRTAEIARGFGGCVRVIETEIPSKSKAWNMGDAAATAFPRFYVDADIILPLASIRAVAEELRRGPALAAAPRIHVDTRRRGWLIRSYFDIWTCLPYFSTGMIGAGVFVLSEAGRRRFGAFPDVYADDEYVRLHFEAHERKTVDSCTFTVTPPDNFADLLKIKTRGRLFKYLLRDQYPELMPRDRKPYGSMLPTLLKQVRLWPRLAVYGVVVVWPRVMAYWKYWRRSRITWDRDESSRAEAVRLSEG